MVGEWPAHDEAAPPVCAKGGRFTKIPFIRSAMIRRGVRRTLALLERRYYWPNMKGDYYVSTFFTCLQDKTERSHPAGLLEPLPIPERPWESLSLDFIVGLPKVGDSFHSCVQVKLSF